jgi:maleylacetate reductase
MGASHAIGYVLGGTCDVLHGGDDARPLRYKQPATPEAQKSIAGALRAPDLDATDAFAGFIGVLGLPSKLSTLGVGKTSSVSLAKRHVFDIYLIHSGTHL